MNALKKTIGIKKLLAGLAIWTLLCIATTLLLLLIGTPVALTGWGIWSVWITGIAIMASDLDDPYQ